MSYKTFPNNAPKPLVIDPEVVANELIERLITSFSLEEQDAILFCAIRQVVVIRKAALEECANLLRNTQKECDELHAHIQKLENLIVK